MIQLQLRDKRHEILIQNIILIVHLTPNIIINFDAHGVANPLRDTSEISYCRDAFGGIPRLGTPVAP